jgi:hypothetical protein
MSLRRRSFRSPEGLMREKMIQRGRRQMKAAMITLAPVVFSVSLAWWRG